MRRLGLVTTLLSLTVFAAPAAASEHLMRVNELLLSADGSPTVRFVELLDSFDEPFPGPNYRLASYQPSGGLHGAQNLGDPFSALDNTKPYLISTTGANTKYGVTGDQAYTLDLPPGDSGQVCFENASTATTIHCLSYGTITAPRPALGGNEHAAIPPDGKSLQRCSAGLVIAAPTPKAGNACSGAGGGGGGGGGGGTATDRRKPKLRLGGRRTQDVDRLAVTARMDEDGTVSATCTVRVPNSSKTFRCKKARKSARKGKRVKLRLKLSRKAKRAVKRALANGKKLKAKIKVTGADKAGNKTTKKRTIRLKN